MSQYAQFVAFDLETTGLSSDKHYIIEVAGVKFGLEIQGNEIRPVEVATYESLVKPPMMIPEEATRINHITNEMVDQAPAAKDVLQEFSRFCGLSTILVAHNADFDRKFLQKELMEHQLVLPQNPIIDSLKISRKIMPESPQHKLETLAKRLRRQIKLSLDSTNLHRALYDCEVLMEVFVAILKKRFLAKDFEMATFLKNVEKVHGPPMFLGK